jgi:ATP-dependent Clp protease ATP-binding subunit ClpA
MGSALSLVLSSSEPVSRAAVIGREEEIRRVIQVLCRRRDVM